MFNVGVGGMFETETREGKKEKQVMARDIKYKYKQHNMAISH